MLKPNKKGEIEALSFDKIWLFIPGGASLCALIVSKVTSAKSM
jgi:hypothetical protein